MSKTLAWLVWVVAFAFFGCFFFYPISHALLGGFLDADGNLTWQYIAEVFRNRIYLEGLTNAVLLGAASTLVTLAVALPLAFVANRFDFPGKAWLTSLLLVPMILPPFVGAMGLRQILGHFGALNVFLEKLGFGGVDWLGGGRFWGIVLVNALHLYPILYLNLMAALANVDPAMEEAAENLGCVGWRRFRKITLPLIAPGVFAGGTLVFIFAFTELGVPLMFDYTRVTSVQIFYGIKEITGNPFPFALVVVMLASSLGLYALSRMVAGRMEYAYSGKATLSAGARPAGPIARWLCPLVFLLWIGLALLPHAGVVGLSLAGEWYRTILPTGWTLDHYGNALGHSMTVPAILNSLKYASLSTMLDLVLGGAIAYVVTRTKLPGRGLLDALTMLPLAVPGLILAFGYVAMTQEGSLLAAFNPGNDPALLLVVAYAVRRMPYVVRAVVAGLQQTSVTLEEAAQNLGAGPFRVLRRITVPLISANLLAGGLLAFSFAMLEVSDSLILAQKHEHFPITKAIYELFQLLGEGRFVASALGVWAMVFLALTIFAASRLLGRKFGALFRI